ncbi:hypothetical protein QBC45DRAFT_475665 [Copromyces sp. CBS 386.78]|nr:hypothetical protein QBC45DRAFT_475665 [Copromyces sp. CBS 386.78]
MHRSWVRPPARPQVSNFFATFCSFAWFPSVSFLCVMRLNPRPRSLVRYLSMAAHDAALGPEWTPPASLSLRRNPPSCLIASLGWCHCQGYPGSSSVFPIPMSTAEELQHLIVSSQHFSRCLRWWFTVTKKFNHFRPKRMSELSLQFICMFISLIWRA